VDASKVTEINEETQVTLYGWHDSSDIHRKLARRVSELLKTNQAEALALRRTLTEWRLLARELRLAAFGGGGR